MSSSPTHQIVASVAELEHCFWGTLLIVRQFPIPSGVSSEMPGVKHHLNWAQTRRKVRKMFKPKYCNQTISRYLLILEIQPVTWTLLTWFDPDSVVLRCSDYNLFPNRDGYKLPIDPCPVTTRQSTGLISPFAMVNSLICNKPKLIRMGGLWSLSKTKLAKFSMWYIRVLTPQTPAGPVEMNFNPPLTVTHFSKPAMIKNEIRLWPVATDNGRHRLSHKSVNMNSVAKFLKCTAISSGDSISMLL